MAATDVLTNPQAPTPQPAPDAIPFRVWAAAQVVAAHVGV